MDQNIRPRRSAEKEVSVGKRRITAAAVVSVCALLCCRVQASDEKEDNAALLEKYREYQQNFEAIETVEDLEKKGYELIEGQCFPVVLETFGEDELQFYTAMEKQYHRIIIIVADARGHVLYKTDQLEMNYKYSGQLEQPAKGIAAVSFQDLDRDGMKDIVIIADCENDEGVSYKMGDVLFQRDGKFYRDWRISDKINRFSMNKSADFIASYVRDGNSTEVLYTAATLDELLENGFRVVEEQSYFRQFEKQGYLRIVPGVLRMADYDVFMIFLVNEEGCIVWSFQPMGEYDSLYAMKGMAVKDVDGDGMKDIVVLAKYSCSGSDGEARKDTKCSIYYQRTDGFVEDREFVETYEHAEEDTVGGLVERIREYWGWTTEE